MKSTSIAPGLLVRDPFGRIGIVYERRERPSESWISDQLNVEDLRTLIPGTLWWAVLPLAGGLVLVAEPMLEALRRASFEDFLEAADHANLEGRKCLALLFPEYVARVVAGGGLDG